MSVVEEVLVKKLAAIISTANRYGISIEKLL